MTLIEITGQDEEALGVGRRGVDALAGEWGLEVTEAATAPQHDAPPDDADKLDPVALAALIVSIPSAALAVVDLADRIRKRRRAAQLVERARELAARGATVRLVVRSRRIELAGLTPDELLELTEIDE